MGSMDRAMWSSSVSAPRSDASELSRETQLVSNSLSSSLDCVNELSGVMAVETRGHEARALH